MYLFQCYFLCPCLITAKPTKFVCKTRRKSLRGTFFTALLLEFLCHLHFPKLKSISLLSLRKMIEKVICRSFDIWNRKRGTEETFKILSTMLAYITPKNDMLMSLVSCMKDWGYKDWKLHFQPRSFILFYKFQQFENPI